MGQKGVSQGNPVLRMLIDEALPVTTVGDLRAKVQINPTELRTVQRLMRLVNTATTAHDKMVTDAYNQLVVRLPAQGYGTTEFDMSDERRVALVEAGRRAMGAYFDSPLGALGAPRALDDSEIARAKHNADDIALRLLRQ